MATKEEKKEWEVWMLSGKAREIVREILSKNDINVDYYLSDNYTSFCEQYFEDYEWEEEIPDYDKSWYGEPDEAFWRILTDEWQESLRALKKLPEEERKEKLGVVTHGIYCDGGTFAQHVIARMFYTATDCSDEVAREIFMDRYFYGDEFISGLHLLDNPQWLTDRHPSYFWIKSTGNFDPIVCFTDDLEIQYKNGNTKTFFHEKELMRLEENRFTTDRCYIYGFLAALLHLIFAHMYTCKMFQLDFAKEEDVERAYELKDKPEIDLAEMPADLLVPAKEIIEIYFPEAIKRYANKLRRSDKAFDGTEEYTKRKMLEMEEEQQKLVTRAPIWHHIPQDVRDMLLDYHRLFIEFLKKECGIDSNVPDVASSVKKGLFKHITPTAYADGKAEQVEQELAMASRGTAAQLCKSLRFNASMNYLSIGSLSVTALYNDINEHFGLNYTERNFNKAYSKIPTRK